MSQILSLLTLLQIDLDLKMWLRLSFLFLSSELKSPRHIGIALVLSFPFQSRGQSARLTEMRHIHEPHRELDVSYCWPGNSKNLFP